MTEKAKKAEKKGKIVRLTDEEIKGLAKKIHDGQVWVLDTEDKLRFGGGLFLLAGLPYSKEELKKAGMVLGSNPIGDRGINGIPLFGTLQVVHKEDWPLIANTYNAMVKAVESVEVVKCPKPKSRK